MRKPLVDKDIFKSRRDKISGDLKKVALIVPAHPEHIRNHDVQHSYRQSSNLFYLTGFEEPGSVLIFRPGEEPETT